jgi:glycosyltransferase involved in cell wall biosynthesis
MTTYDSERHVREAAESILAQDLADLELIVVDDGSTDRTLAILESIADPRLRVLRIPRCGRIPSLNHGFRAARAEFVANQDADDVSLPHRLRVEVEALRGRPRLAVVGAGIVPQVDDAGNPLALRTRPVGAGSVRKGLGHSMVLFHSSCTYRRAAWEEAGGFDESLPCWEDYDLCVRLAARHEVDNVPAALGLKRRHAGQAFDGMHWTRRGYRARARILLRYFRRVRHDPVVLLRAAAFLAMGPGLRLAWLRVTRRDPAEIQLNQRLVPRGKA